MADHKNPFQAFDLAKMMSEFKIPGVDWEAMMTSQRRNIEALTSANHVAVEAMQQITRRQAEILRQNIEEATKIIAHVGDQVPPAERMAKQSELVRLAVEKSLNNMRELAELVTKANQETYAVINARVAAGVDELRAAVSKATPGKK